MEWNYKDGTKFTLNPKDKTWTYDRAQTDTADLQPDIYVFEIDISSRYGKDTATLNVTTDIPKAEIVSFVAENIGDDENLINGTLEYTMPSIVRNPTIRIDVTVNGIAYVTTALPITGQALSFEYSNGAKLVVNPANHTFTYTRDSNEVGNNEPDSYVFELSIAVNGQTTTQTATSKSMAGQRVYDYEPAYPVNVAPGSVERQNTAWPKYVMEIQRIYRQFNENLNYYEALANELKKQVAELRNYVDNRFTEYDKTLDAAIKKLSAIRVKAITGVAYHGETIPVPVGSKRENCVCLVSLKQWSNTSSDNKYTYDMYIWVDSNWVLTCYTSTNGRDGSGGTYAGWANYLVIDVTTLI